jgi:tryptophan synthase alpha chain
VQGLIVPDLPLGEDALLRGILTGAGLDLISLVGPNTGAERMKAYAKKARGYVYVVSVMGTTGAREGLPPEAEVTIAKAQRLFSLPVALGFGLREPGQLAGMKNPPQAAVFGSALLRHLDQGGAVRDFMDTWMEAPRSKG